MTEPSPTKAAVCVMCGHNKLQCTETVWATDDIRAEPAPCLCACVFPTPEPAEPLTVESCLKELREMFPQTPVRLSIRQDFVLNGASRDPSDVEIYIGRNGDYTYFEDVEISDCMSQVRRWKESQQQ